MSTGTQRVNSRAAMFREYAQWIGQGSVTRTDAAEAFNVSKSTARYHLERAVSEGLLVKVYSWAHGNQMGFVYMSSSQPELPFEYPDGEYWPDEPDIEALIERSREGYSNG